MPSPSRPATALRLLAAVLLCLLPSTAQGRGPVPSPIAQEMQKHGDLIPFSPSAEVLAGYFVADEAAPELVYGPLRDYVASRLCRTAWLIERGEKARLDRAAGQAAPLEYSLVLEEDCDDRVTHATFVLLRPADPKAWLEWRSQFHKSKTEGHYGAARARLEKAASDGFSVSGELRFFTLNEELLLRPVEQTLKADRRTRPVYDLVTGRRTGR